IQSHVGPSRGRCLPLLSMAMPYFAVLRPLLALDTAARAARILMNHLTSDEPLPADTILNVNVPDLPWDEIRGFETTRLGHRHRSEDVIPLDDPRGRQFFWIGAPGGEEDNGPGTDFHAIRRGYVSVTPIHVDLTRYQALEQVGHWVQKIQANVDAA
ncbi:MAG: 5'/3'-nucleotidase SurE, partial [Wenzhouxiangellaceae bacterium]